MKYCSAYSYTTNNSIIFMPSESSRGRRRYCRCLQSPHCHNTVAPRTLSLSVIRVSLLRPVRPDCIPVTDCTTDVAILYQIVKSAEQHPDVGNRPFRAMYTAYETILPRNGLHPDHDQIYLPYLYKLGGKREEGQSLYESFESLLAELGFQIEFVADGEGAQEITKNLGAEYKAENGVDGQIGLNNGSRRRPRRTSFNSIYDAEGESTRAIRPRDTSRASMSRLETSQSAILDIRPSTRATTRNTEKTSANALSSKPPTVPARRGRLTAEEFAKGSSYSQRRPESISSQRGYRRNIRSGSTPSNRNARVHAALVSEISPNSSHRQSDTSQALHVSHDLQPPYVLGQNERFYNPSKTQLLRDAYEFHNYRIRSVARDAVDKWCFAAFQARDQHEHMERLAAAHDKEILLRQAFEHWRLRLHARKQAAETERFFSRLERRATKARDLYLLAKAFSHWAQCTQEEILRTFDARQHILSTKYFRAWHEITIVNQLKMRRQGLRKFFSVWKQRYITAVTSEIKADLRRHDSLLRNTYWHWFWYFCERRAPEWRAARLKRKYLFQCVATWRSNVRLNQQVALQSINKSRKKILLPWLEKARFAVSALQDADSFSRQRQAAHTLQTWRRITQYAPLARQVSNMVDWRVAGETFSTFIFRYRFEKQAESVSRLRIMRTAWTHWNDRLRWQSLARRLDDRFLLESLYKWVIAERYLLLHRLSEERLKQRMLNILKQYCRLRQAARENGRQVTEEAQKERFMRSLIRCWHSQLVLYRQDERIAFEFGAPKVAQEAMQLWTQGLGHVQDLNSMAKHANDYFLQRYCYKRWQSATTNSKRQKRRNAYVQVRRRSKMSLAARVLRQWHSLSAKTQDMHRQAGFVSQNRLLQVGTGFFDHWTGQYDLRKGQDYQATQHYQKRLLERHLYTWIERLEGQVTLEETAELNNEMRVKNIAFSWCNKLRLKIIELKGREANAENLRAWYEKRHFRNLLRHWQAQTAAKVDRTYQQTTFSSRIQRARPPAEAADRDGSTRQAEDWTDFDVGDWIPALEAQSSNTPLPGYLSTPSKRAARAKAMVRVSTTPAGTPFAHRHRIQTGSTPQTSRRGAFGKSATALRGSTFGTITEDSPKTP